MLILHNGQIYTPDVNNPATAIAIENDKIMAIGQDSDILNISSPNDKCIDLEEQVVYPGLTDAHIHLKQYAQQINKIDCETESRIQCLNKVERKAKLLNPGEWILGHGWNQNVWKNGFGTYEDLDNVSPNNPVCLTSKSLHATWLNSLAIEYLHHTDFKQRMRPEWVKTDHNGISTGIFFEEAVFIIDSLLPKPTMSELARSILLAQDKLIEMGITNIHDFDSFSMFDVYQILQQNKELMINIIKFIPYEDISLAIENKFFTGYIENKLSIGGIKLFADGALGTLTAAMLEPYDTDMNNYGIMNTSPEEIFEKSKVAVDHGFSLAIHAIGDKANRLVLNNYKKLRSYEHDNALQQKRHRIEHVQLIHPSDHKRLKNLKIIASMQPVHIHGDINAADVHWGKRSAYAYPFKSLLKNNTRIIFGSDAPVETPNPFFGIHAAIYRENPSDHAEGKYWSDYEKLSYQEALNAYIPDHVQLFGNKYKFGKLKKYYQANLLILNKNPEILSSQELMDIKPNRVMIDGKWVK